MCPLASSQSAMFLLNSRMGPFTAPPGIALEDPFFRSYGAILPSSLTRFLSRALVYVTLPPVSVLVRIPIRFLEAFPGSTASRASGGKPPSPSPFGLGRADLPAQPAYGFGRAIHQAAPPAHSRLHRSNSLRKYGNVDPSSIGYALRPRLRNRLTLGGRTCPRKPWNSGGRDFHPAFRYSCPHSRPHALHRTSRSGFGAHGALLYHSAKTAGPRLRHPVYSRSFSAQDLSTSQLLRTV